MIMYIFIFIYISIPNLISSESKLMYIKEI